jgi:hypothetical protein
MRPPRKRFQRGVRRSRNFPATLVESGSPDRRCVVSDISEGGAKIVVEGRDPIPAHFALSFDNGARRTCELIWWHGKTAGLKFVR